MPALEEKEWTIMFYFASDNPLAPEIISQLKSIKQAGFHPEANVIARFDPHTENTPTYYFDVNRINKLKAEAKADRLGLSLEAEGEPEQEVKARVSEKKSQVGFVGRTHDDPFVVNVMLDTIFEKGAAINKQINQYLVTKKIKYDPPVLPEYDDADEPGGRRTAAARGKTTEADPKISLQRFLKFCSDNYPARHYMLFILGHGVVVANDTFLLDEHPAQSSLKLTELHDLLKEFKSNIEVRDGVETHAEFELVGFHSCSMSSLEVAYELKETANFMLASQGPAFVGSWPYRQILVRVFNDLKSGRGNVRSMLKKIFYYCLYNSHDFLVAGYSFDLCLCDLTKVLDVKGPLSTLSTVLKAALSIPLARERILLAHWDAQSYWLENYTDLYDFCFRLQKRCRSDEADDTSEPLHPGLKDVIDACEKVKDALRIEAARSVSRGAYKLEEEIELCGSWVTSAPEKKDKKHVERFIVCSGFTGPSTQYSNGVSVYFPWSRPVRDVFWTQYQGYTFARDIPWWKFLDAYLNQTRRKPRVDERGEAQKKPSLQKALIEKFAAFGLQEYGQLSKGSPSSSTGDGFEYLTIKNYPPFLREPVTPSEASEPPGKGESERSRGTSPRRKKPRVRTAKSGATG